MNYTYSTVKFQCNFLQAFKRPAPREDSPKKSPLLSPAKKLFMQATTSKEYQLKNVIHKYSIVTE
jgi:hypothetical protein